MIPKVIHYCWFGGNDIPRKDKEYIQSWKKYLPGYEIKRWDESNFDVQCCDFVSEAYDARKWAFVSDYARFWILYHYGGLYFDTDVELIKPIDDLIQKGAFMGCEKNPEESKTYMIAPGLGLCFEKGDQVIKEILDYYNQIHFLNPDGSYNYTETVVGKTTKIFRQYGFKGEGNIEQIRGIYIYPWDYFCPMNYITGEITLTKNTRSIHHYSASWFSPLDRKIALLLRCDKKRHPIEYLMRYVFSIPLRAINKFFRIIKAK